jgi:multimeric flavodoxin WrbA
MMKTEHNDGDRSIARSPFFVCAINGSSRVKGKTAEKLDKILKDAKALGAKTELIHLAQYPLQPCDGSQNPQRQPDIQKLLKSVEKADGVVFGTPTYMFNMSGLMKNFIDRLLVTEAKWTLEYKVAGFVATGHTGEDGAMIAITSMAGALNHLGMVIFPYSMIYFRGNGPSWANKDLPKFAKRMLDMVKITAPFRGRTGRVKH